MIIRDCAGGIVFYENLVLLIKNDKGEWSFPKGVLRDGIETDDLAVYRVQFETGVKAHILALAGRTDYEFYSRTRECPIANRIVWYVMSAGNAECKPNYDYGLADAVFYPVSDALELVTYSQERALLSLAYQKYLALSRSDV